MPPESESRCHLTLLRGSCLTLQPLAPAQPGGRGRTAAAVVAKVDAHVPHVPEALITFVLRASGWHVWGWRWCPGVPPCPVCADAAASA